MEYYYKIFGLKFESEIEFPELKNENFVDYNIQILSGENPAHLTTIEDKGILFEASINDFLFQLDNIGSFRVQNGNLITVDTKSTSSISEIRTFLFGPVMGALLHQRGVLALHGCTIDINGEALTILGHSSTGKSSLAAGFAEDGFQVLSDDISAMTFDGKSNFLIQPGLPYLRLWEDVLKYMYTDFVLDKVRPNINKYIKPLNHAHSLNPLPIRKIICLETMNTIGFLHEEVVGSEKFDLLKNHTYRYQYLNGLKQVQNHFNQISSLSDQIILHKLKRQKFPIAISELVQYITEHILQS